MLHRKSTNSTANRQFDIFIHSDKFPHSKGTAVIALFGQKVSSVRTPMLCYVYAIKVDSMESKGYTSQHQR